MSSLRLVLVQSTTSKLDLRMQAQRSKAKPNLLDNLYPALGYYLSNIV